VKSSSDQQLWIRRGGAIAAAVVVVVIAYLLISGGDDNGSGDGEPVSADATEIQNLAADLGHPVYWAGATGAENFEWTELADGRVYIRYLTGGAEAGDTRPLYLTVATYPVGDGLAAIRDAAKSPGSRTFNVPGGGTGLVNRGTPSSVYLAYPNSEYQVEVFNPDPARALQLVKSGQIQPVT
jgi:hypothetical protein